MDQERRGALKSDPRERLMLKGTLNLLILKALTVESQYGQGVARWRENTSLDMLRIEVVSIHPALYRPGSRGWIRSEWGQSETNRKAKSNRLTAKGRARLLEEASGWKRLVKAVTLVPGIQPAGAGES